MRRTEARGPKIFLRGPGYLYFDPWKFHEVATHFTFCSKHDPQIPDYFWCPMGVTIWTIGNGGHYASDGRTIKIFAQNLVDHGSTKIPYFDDFPF